MEIATTNYYQLFNTQNAYCISEFISNFLSAFLNHHNIRNKGGFILCFLKNINKKHVCTMKNRENHVY